MSRFGAPGAGRGGPGRVTIGDCGGCGGCGASGAIAMPPMFPIWPICGGTDIGCASVGRGGRTSGALPAGINRSFPPGGDVVVSETPSSLAPTAASSTPTIKSPM